MPISPKQNPSAWFAQEPGSPQQAFIYTARHVVLFLLIACLLLVARDPRLLTQGRIWAEEGTVYLRFAWENNAVHALLAHHQGYYALVPNVVGLVAAREVPLTADPFIFVWCAGAFQLLAAWLMFDAEVFTTLPTKLAAVCVVLLTPSSSEVWLNITNSQSFLLLCSLAVLLSSPAKSYKTAVLVIACLTGVLSCLLSPFFAVKAYFLRTKAAVSQATLAIACTLLQFGLIISIGLRHSAHSARYLAQAALVKNSFLLFGTGVSAYRASDAFLAHPAAAAVLAPVLLLVFSGCLLGIALRGGRLAVTCLLIGLWVELFSVFTGLDMTRAALRPYFNGRYFFILNACIGLSLVAVLQNSRSELIRRLSVFLLLCMLASGVYESFKAMPRPLKNWDAQVAQWRKHPETPLHITPGSWSPLYLTPDHPNLQLPDDVYDSTKTREDSSDGFNTPVTP